MKVPSLSKHVSGLAEKEKIFASVVVATGKGQLKSNRLSFTFLPDGKQIELTMFSILL